MSYYQDKVVWIIGCSSGAGRVIALDLAKQGAKLILSSRRIKELEELASEISRPEKTKVKVVDLEKIDSSAQLVDEVHSCFGKIDYFINCAGLGQRGSVEEMPMEIERKIFEVNFWGGVSLVKAIIPVMKSQLHGNIVVITSIIGKFGLAKHAAYCASKHAMHGYYETLAQELSPMGISVNIICPGNLRTEITHNFFLPDGSRYGKNTPAQENGMKLDIFSTQVLRAIKKGKKHTIIASFSEKLALLFKQNFVNLFYWLINKMLERKRAKLDYE